MSETVRCPRCRTLLAVPPRAGTARMTCSVCLSPVGATPAATPAAPAAPAPPEPEMLSFDEPESVERDVYSNAFTSRIISVAVFMLMIFGFPSLVRGRSSADTLLGWVFLGLVATAIMTLFRKPSNRPLLGETPTSSSSGVLETIFTVLGVIAVGIAQALLGLIITGALLFFLLWITCVGMMSK